MNHVLALLHKAGEPHGVLHYGICPLGALPPLLPNHRQKALPQNGSVLLALLPYYTGRYPGGNVSLYAVPDDYHQIAGAILDDMIALLSGEYPENCFYPFVDSSPIPEVAAGTLAGLGYCGKNGQLITPWYGSLAFLCEIVTDLVLPATAAMGAAGSCGDCHQCLVACPTGALHPTGVDKSRCRSAITQKKGVLTDWDREQILLGGFVWGCDLCTLACPHNQAPAPTTIRAFAQNTTPVVTRDALTELLPHKSYGWRGRAVLERNLSIIDEKESC